MSLRLKIPRHTREILDTISRVTKADPLTILSVVTSVRGSDILNIFNEISDRCSFALKQSKGKTLTDGRKNVDSHLPQHLFDYY